MSKAVKCVHKFDSLVRSATRSVMCSLCGYWPPANKQPKFHVGDKIKFLEEKGKYTVQACDHRYLICTKPFNLKKTVFYTIVDFDREVRGTENLVFCMGFETQKLCFEALERLQTGESEVSYRNFIDLNIE